MQALATIASRVIESDENANGVVDLLEHLQDGDTPTALAAIEGIGEVFCHYIPRHYTWLASQGCEVKSEDASRDPLVKFGAWLKDKYKVAVQELLKLIEHPQLQDTALSVLMRFVKAEGHTHQSTHSCYYFPNQLFSMVIHSLLSTEKDNAHIISIFSSSYLENADIAFYVMKNMIKRIKSVIQIKQGPPQCHWFSNNCCQLLQAIVMPTSKEQLSADAVRHYLGTCAKHVCSLQRHKNLFSDCWLTFLQLPNPSSILKKVLVSLHTSVMPHMNDPRLLLDFLIGAYDQGGVCAILSLNGLFLLINQYHLDYPNFYDKLYVLMEPSVMQVKYMPRFFYLVNVFLSSTHLPIYLVAAFAKKIARLCLTAPPNGVMVGVVMVVNLLHRHPNCKVLLHRSNPNILHLPDDPYEMSEIDPAKSHALESCLWELQALQSHWHPAVSSLVSRLLNPDRSWQREEPLGKYLDLSAADLFDQELVKDTPTAPPLNFIEPEGLWEASELESLVET